MAVDMFLKIDGIDGESTDDRHKGEIEIESFSWGETQSGGAAHGGGGGAGKVSMQDFHFVMRSSKASPKLFLACATGQHIKEAQLSVEVIGERGRTAKDQVGYLKYKLTDILVSSYKTAGTGADDALPVEEVALNFAKIEVDQNGVRAGFDLRQNRLT